MLNWNKKEAPLKALAGLGGGVGRGGGGPLGDDPSNPYTSWTDLNAEGFTSTTKYLELGGQTLNVTIDSGGYANFFRNNNEYTLLLWGTGYNVMCGSATGPCNNIATYTVGNIQGGSQGYDTNASPGNDWIDFNWRDTDGTLATAAFFNAMDSQLGTGYKPNSFYLGGNDVETSNSWNFKYSDGTTDAFDQQDNHGSTNLSIVARDLSSTLQNTWVRNDKIMTAFKDSKGSDPAGVIFTWRHAALAIK
jgi:hypothetical protein